MPTVLIAPPLADCWALYDQDPLVPRPFAQRALESLGRGEGSRWAVLEDGALRLMGVMVDSCASRDNCADLLALGGRPQDLRPEQVDALLAAAESIIAAGPRSGLDVNLLPDRLAWLPAVQARGYVHNHSYFNMRRDPTPVEEPPLPPDMRWEPVTSHTVLALRELVGRAFEGIPGFMMPDPEPFTHYTLSASFPARLLMQADRMLGYVRVMPQDDGVVDIASLGRDPSARGLGLGQRILTHGLRCALDLGAQSITLEVAAVNQRALELYLRHGFEHTSEVATYRRTRA